MGSDRLAVLRVAAGLTAAGTVAFLFIGGDWRWSNLFLVPDLALCLALGVSAGLPGRFARAGLSAAFAYAAGVFSAAVMSYAVEGRMGWGATVGLTTAVGAWLVLAFARDGRPDGRERS